jgi:hypothetical protein
MSFDTNAYNALIRIMTSSLFIPKTQNLYQYRHRNWLRERQELGSMIHAQNWGIWPDMLHAWLGYTYTVSYTRPIPRAAINWDKDNNAWQSLTEGIMHWKEPAVGPLYLGRFSRNFNEQFMFMRGKFWELCDRSRQNGPVVDFRNWKDRKIIL